MYKFLTVIVTKFQELDQELSTEPHIESLCVRKPVKSLMQSLIASSLKFRQRK